MKKIITMLTGIFLFASSSYGQSEDLDTVFIRYNKGWNKDTTEYVTDTITFETGLRRHILTGTTILPWTGNQQNAKNYGVYFDKVTKSDCQKGNEPPYGNEMQDNIHSIEYTDSTLTVNFTLYDNCCYDFLCDISVDTAGTLHLIYNGYGTYCFCTCCFGLTYHFSLWKDEDLSEIKAVMINNDPKTLKPIKTKESGK